LIKGKELEEIEQYVYDRVYYGAINSGVDIHKSSRAARLAVDEFRAGGGKSPTKLINEKITAAKKG